MKAETEGALLDPAGSRVAGYGIPILLLGLLILSWGWLMAATHYYWGMESYYNFGWFVPLLAGYFFYRILKEDRFALKENAGFISMAAFGALLVGTVFLVALVRLFSEANPFWRVPLWGHGFLLLGFSYGCLFIFGGWRALARFAFPFFFLLMALPWPWRFETWLIQALTGWVTDLTVSVVNFIGYPAHATGNTIQVAETQVGVEEACSGIRSLQALIMMALFFGEFLRFDVFRRLFLIVGAVVLSMGFNGFRAVSLTLVTVNGDAESFQFWHDFLGNFNAIICSVLLFLLAEALVILFGKSDKAEKPVIHWRLHDRKPLLGVGLAVVGGFLLSEAAVRGYFRYQEMRIPKLPPLVIEWPDKSIVETSFSEIPEDIQEILMCDFGKEVDITWDNGVQAQMTYYGYTGENRIASVSSFGHSPTICLTSIGARLDEEKEPLMVELKGLPWKLNHYEFSFPQRGNMPIQVFYLVWEAQQMGVTAQELESMTWRNQWRLVASGRRQFERQVILIYFPGEYPPEALRLKVQELLDAVVS